MVGKSSGKRKNPFVDALINIAKNKDMDSFRTVFDHFGPRLKTFLMMSGTEEVIAEEIVQETMATVWNKADYFDHRIASPSTWIYTIARNKKIDLSRKTRRAQFEDIETAILPPILPDYDDAIEHNQKFDHINEYLHELPDEQLSLLRLNFFEEKSHAEIAEITKIPLGTVKSRIRLALEKIRTKLEKNGRFNDLSQEQRSIN